MDQPWKTSIQVKILPEPGRIYPLTLSNWIATNKMVILDCFSQEYYFTHNVQPAPLTGDLKSATDDASSKVSIQVVFDGLVRADVAATVVGSILPGTC
jgi:hypothetical protein